MLPQRKNNANIKIEQPIVAKKKDDRIVISHIHACKFRKLLYQKFTGLANRVVWANLLCFIFKFK